jgi:transposase-like protein
MDTENFGRRLFTQEEAARFFRADLINEEACNLWIVSQLHPVGVFCPECSMKITDDRQAKFYRFEQIRCPGCGKKFTAATGKVINGAKLEPRDIFLLGVMSHWGVAASTIAGVLGCHIDTVTNWQAHFTAHQELPGA